MFAASIVTNKVTRRRLIRWLPWPTVARKPEEIAAVHAEAFALAMNSGLRSIGSDVRLGVTRVEAVTAAGGATQVMFKLRRPPAAWGASPDFGQASGSDE